MSILSQNRVLVLNKLWVALRVITVRQAIELLTNQNGTKAKIIDATNDFATFTWEDWADIRPSKDDEIIRGVKRDYKVPSIIMVTNYSKLPSYSTNFSRSNIYRRDNCVCQYCGEKLSTENCTIDHVTPKSQGGKTDWLNCVIACVKCNSQKANRLPEDAVRGRKQQDYDPIRCPEGWKGSSPMKLRKKPEKPKAPLWRGDRKAIPNDWKSFISEAYWSVTLDNDIED